ncbi:MAG TPA: winged helix-turn-helix domain-containing protein, partial [Candidatus Wunengus sp. YC61]
DVHIASLRKKLKAYANRIVTIRGIGYKFKE